MVSIGDENRPLPAVSEPVNPPNENDDVGVLAVGFVEAAGDPKAGAAGAAGFA